MQGKRKARRASAQEEQLRLLGQILAELQRLNASLAAGKTDTQGATEPVRSSYDSDDDELEEYE